MLTINVRIGASFHTRESEKVATMKAMTGGLFLGVVACLAVMLLVGPATPVSAQSQVQDVIRPDTPLDPLVKPKVSFNHDNRPEPVDHDGNPVENPNPIGWLWHPGEDYRHVAGIKFKLKYDPYEVNILGINNTFGGIAGTPNGHFNFEPPPPLEPSEGEPVPASSLPGVVRGTVWLPHFLANESGIDLAESQEIPIFDLIYQPRHTSHASEAQFNSEVDVRVSELRPIFHIAQEDERHLSSVWVPRHVGPDEPNVPVPASEMLWEHKGSTMGVIVPNSRTVFPGPLASNSNVPAPSGIHVDAKIPPSAVDPHQRADGVDRRQWRADRPRTERISARRPDGPALRDRHARQFVRRGNAARRCGPRWARDRSRAGAGHRGLARHGWLRRPDEPGPSPETPARHVNTSR